MGRDKNKFGQYMTPELISKFMVDLITHENTGRCLEPSCGDGSFLRALRDKGYNNVDSYEIDPTIINKEFQTFNESFLGASTAGLYDVVVGNPPYIRWKHLEEPLKKELSINKLWNTYCDSLCDYSLAFILKAVESLKENGELIFITPDYWFTTSHANRARNYLLENGSITDVYHFNETPIFNGVKVSLIIFRYVKGVKVDKVNVYKHNSTRKMTENDLQNIPSNKIKQFTKGNRWLLIPDDVSERLRRFELSCAGRTLSECVQVMNGMVSGCDKAFQIRPTSEYTDKECNSIINVIKAKNLNGYDFKESTSYFLINDRITEDEFNKDYPHFKEHLTEYKDTLKNRYDYGKDLKYWEWAFLRNYDNFNALKELIFVPCKDRVTKRTRFRFTYVPEGYYPVQDVVALYYFGLENPFYVIAFLNSKYVFDWLCNNGIRKGDIVEFSEKPLLSVPYRVINKKDKTEVELHNRIVALVHRYMVGDNTLAEIDECFDKLMVLNSTNGIAKTENTGI